MKFVGIIFTVAIYSVSVQCLNLPFLRNNNSAEPPKFDLGKEVKKDATGLVNVVKDTGEKVLKEVQKHTDNSVDTVKQEKLMESLKLEDSGNDIFKNAAGLMSEADHFMDQLTDLQKKVLNAANDLLNKTENEIQKSMSEVNEKVNNMVNKTTSDLMDQSTNLEKWEKDALKPYKGKTQYADAEKLLQDFIKDSKDNMKSCVEHVLKPLQELEAYVNETAIEVIRQARNVVSLAGNCSMLREKALEHMINCLKGIPNSVFDANVFISMKILPIREKLLYYGVSQVAYSTCIVAITTFTNIGKTLKEHQLSWLK